MTDKLHEAIGALAMSFANLDFIMCAILSELMETDFGTAMIVSSALEHRKKQQLVSSLAKIKLQLNPALLAKVTDFLAKSNGMAKERNYAVHSMWSTDEKGRDKIISVNNSGQFEVMMKPRAPNHMMSKATQTHNLTNCALDLAVEIKHAVATWRKNFPQ